jgi:NADH:ubiquinone oxidoreductase subunit 6 (subunit J)
MSLDDVLFLALAAIALASGWRVFVTDSMVRASFLLMTSFIAVGLAMLLMAAPYLGIATIFMMAVEMMVMALFMVAFMMNPAGLNPMSMVHQHRFAIAAGTIAFLGLAAAIVVDAVVAEAAPDRFGIAVVRQVQRCIENRSVLDHVIQMKRLGGVAQWLPRGVVQVIVGVPEVDLVEGHHDAGAQHLVLDREAIGLDDGGRGHPHGGSGRQQYDHADRDRHHQLHQREATGYPSPRMAANCADHARPWDRRG